MTRLLLPHVYGDDVVRTLVARYAPADWEVVPVYTPPEDPTAYHRALCAEWEKPGDLVVIEQDCAVGPEAFPRTPSPIQASILSSWAGSACMAPRATSASVRFKRAPIRAISGALARSAGAGRGRRECSL